MKALIVDDELHVRQAIRILVEWEKFEINSLLEASNVEEAIQIIQKEKPEIVFTDMSMPNRNGDVLLKYVYENLPHAKTIVISGYDDFEYVRHSVKYGSVDYLLKPIEEEELIEAVQKAVEGYREEERKRKKNLSNSLEVNTLKPMYYAKIFSSMLEDDCCEFPPQVLEEFDLEKDSWCQVVISKFDRQKNNFFLKFGQQKDLFFFTVVNLCNEIIKEYCNGYAFKSLNDKEEIILFIWNHFESLELILNEINTKSAEILGGTFEFGIGKKVRFSSNIKAAYEGSQKALKQRNLLLGSEETHFLKEENAAPIHNFYFKNYEYNLGFAVRSGQEKELEKRVKQWIGDLKVLEVVTEEDIEFFIYEYNTAKLHWIQAALGEENRGMAPVLLGSSFMLSIVNEKGIFDFDSFEKLILKDLQKLLVLLQQYTSKSSIINEIKKYIEENYAQEISLTDLANQFFLSREHLSRRFKQETDETISEYIVRVRMEKASILLSDEKNKVKEVAEQVGYPDYKYFCRVFKKIIGVSPTKYREELKVTR